MPTEAPQGSRGCRGGVAAGGASAHSPATPPCEITRSPRGNTEAVPSLPLPRFPTPIGRAAPTPDGRVPKEGGAATRRRRQRKWSPHPKGGGDDTGGQSASGPRGGGGGLGDSYWPAASRQPAAASKRPVQAGPPGLSARCKPKKGRGVIGTRMARGALAHGHHRPAVEREPVTLGFTRTAAVTSPKDWDPGEQGEHQRP